MEPRDDQDHLSQITTRWSLLLQANRPESADRAAQAELLVRYARPVFRYLRRLVGDADAARDLCQDFALRFLRGDFRHARPERGRFRDYLKTALYRLAADYRRRQARVRDVEFESQRLAAELEAEGETEREFHALWRSELLDQTWAALARVAAPEGRRYPRRTAEWIAGELGRRHGRPVTAAGARQLLHRARERFSDLLRQEVARSLRTDDPDEVRAELAELGLLIYCAEPAARSPRPGGAAAP